MLNNKKRSKIFPRFNKQMSFNVTQFKKYKEDFIRASKRILKKNKPKNENTLKDIEKEIINAHDKICEYIAPFYDHFDTLEKQTYRNELIYLRDKTLKCFGALNCKKKVSNFILNTLNENDDITDFSETDSNSEGEEELNGSFRSTFDDDSIFSKTLHNISIEHMSNGQTIALTANLTKNTTNPLTENTDQTMAVTLIEYLRFAASVINKNYSGDPLALSAFINAVNLVKRADKNNEFVEDLRDFVLSKLEGKALECINQEGTLENILATLKEHIKPDSSSVITGRMLALKLSKHTTQNFAEEAEKLADALQRSLVVEGISLEKAKQMSVENTVKMCRQSARSDLVKSVLASTSFKDPKEVIAKLITEQTTHEQEKQILAFQNQNFRKNGGRFDKKFSGQNNNRGYKKYNNNGNRQNNGYKKNFNGRKNYNGNNRNNYNVRVTENYEGPSNSDGQNNQNQTFTLERANNR